MCSQLMAMGEVEGLQGGGSAEPSVQGAAHAHHDHTAAGSSTLCDDGHDEEESRVTALCRELLSRLPSDPYPIAEVRRKYPMKRELSMNSVLVQEL